MTFNFINIVPRDKLWSSILYEFLGCKDKGKHVSMISKFETNLDN